MHIGKCIYLAFLDTIISLVDSVKSTEQAMLFAVSVILMTKECDLKVGLVI